MRESAQKRGERSGPTEPANSVGAAWLGPGHLESSRGSGAARLSHQADDRGLRALHAAAAATTAATAALSQLHLLIGPMITSVSFFPHYTQLDLH